MAENKRFMEAVAAKVGGKRKPMMKRKGAPSVVIAIGAPKPAPAGREDESAPEDMAEDKQEYGKMCECPECGHKFDPEAESEDEADGEMED